MCFMECGLQEEARKNNHSVNIRFFRNIHGLIRLSISLFTLKVACLDIVTSISRADIAQQFPSK